MTLRFIMQTLIIAACALFVASASAITPCPHPCECFAADNGIQVANCTDLPDLTDKVTTIAWPQKVLRIRFDDHRASPIMLKNKEFERFPRLTYLDVAGGTVQYVGHAAFDGLPELLELNLVRTGIRKLHRDTFAGHRKLAFLSLKNNPRLFVGPSFLVSESITELDLSECALTSLKSVYFKSLPNLKYLFAANNHLKVLGSQFGPAGLKYVDLGHNQIEYVHEDLEAYKRLRTIVLTGNPINCTCELSEVDKRLTSRGVAFGNTVVCKNTGKPLSDMAEACSDKDMMGDGPADMYQADNLLKIDQKSLQSMDDMDDMGSGSGSGDGELFDHESPAASADNIDALKNHTDVVYVQTNDAETADGVKNVSTATGVGDATTARPPGPSEVREAETVTTGPAPTEDSSEGVRVQPLPPVVLTASSDGNSSGNIESKKIQAPEEEKQANDVGTLVHTQVTDYLKSNAGVTLTAALLAVVLVAIVYKAACAGRSRSHDIGANVKEVELKEMKYVAANAEEDRGGHESPTTGDGSAADEEDNLLDDDRDTDDDDDDDDEDGAESPPSPAVRGPAQNGLLDAANAGQRPETASPSGSPDVPTRVIVKLTETPKPSKPVTINNVH